MYAKYAAACPRAVRNVSKSIRKSASLYGCAVVLVSIVAFLFGFASTPPAHPLPDEEYLESGPASFILQQSISRTNVPRYERSTQDDRTKVNIFIAIFTPADGESGDYGRRRKAIRETFLPNLEEVAGVEAKFIVGRVSDPGLAVRAKAEQTRYASSFLAVDAKDCTACSGLRACSACMTEKLLAFYRAVTTQYDARWVIKADDDVYLSPLRLTAAAAQWDRMGAEYVGCMKQGVVLAQPDHRWFEPAAQLLGPKYCMHALGAVYVVAGHVVSDALATNSHVLRRLSFEDTSMGLWMLAFNVTYFEDKRICQAKCHSHAIGFIDPACQGGCDASASLHAFHDNFLCTRDVPNGGPLRYLPSGPGHASFDAMRVLV
eukprot:jgi/Ulvmu1/10947/UM007_0126.1